MYNTLKNNYSKKQHDGIDKKHQWLNRRQQEMYIKSFPVNEEKLHPNKLMGLMQCSQIKNSINILLKKH